MEVDTALLEKLTNEVKDMMANFAKKLSADDKQLIALEIERIMAEAAEANENSTSEETRKRFKKALKRSCEMVSLEQRIANLMPFYWKEEDLKW